MGHYPNDPGVVKVIKFLLSTKRIPRFIQVIISMWSGFHMSIWSYFYQIFNHFVFPPYNRFYIQIYEILSLSFSSDSFCLHTKRESVFRSTHALGTLVVLRQGVYQALESVTHRNERTRVPHGGRSTKFYRVLTLSTQVQHLSRSFRFSLRHRKICVLFRQREQ